MQTEEMCSVARSISTCNTSLVTVEPRDRMISKRDRRIEFYLRLLPAIRNDDSP